MRLNVSSRAVRACVVVRYKTYSWYFVLCVSFQCGVNIAFLVHFHVAQPLVFQFLFQVFCKHQLFRRTRHTVAILARLRIELRIIQKSFCNIHLFYVLRGKVTHYWSKYKIIPRFSVFVQTFVLFIFQFFVFCSLFIVQNSLSLQPFSIGIQVLVYGR